MVASEIWRGLQFVKRSSLPWRKCTRDMLVHGMFTEKLCLGKSSTECPRATNDVIPQFSRLQHSSPLAGEVSPIGTSIGTKLHRLAGISMHQSVLDRLVMMSLILVNVAWDKGMNEARFGTLVLEHGLQIFNRIRDVSFGVDSWTCKRTAANVLVQLDYIENLA